jgi:hypothetical protein
MPTNRANFWRQKFAKVQRICNAAPLLTTHSPVILDEGEGKVKFSRKSCCGKNLKNLYVVRLGLIYNLGGKNGGYLDTVRASFEFVHFFSEKVVI